MKKSSSENEIPSTVHNEFFIDLTGADELYVSGDDNVGVDFIDDIIDGDAAILNDLIDSEPRSTETILEAWRNSVSRQHDGMKRITKI